MKLWSPRHEDIHLVSYLISHDSHTWNSKLIHDIFSEEETRLILGTPLSRGNCADRMIWHYEKSGKFIVKSAYKLGLQLAKQGQLLDFHEGESSSLERPLARWSYIWKIKAPKKFKC